MLSPFMDPTLVGICIRAFDICCLGSIVERLSGYVGNMSESIPLRPTLRIKGVDIVVGHTQVSQGFYLVFESRAIKCWHVGDVQWQV